MYFIMRYSGTKWLRDLCVEDRPLSPLRAAPTLDPEESASHHSSFALHEPEIWQIKGGPGIQTGGTPSSQSGGHMSPEGECFAPFLKIIKSHPDASKIISVHL